MTSLIAVAAVILLSGVGIAAKRLAPGKTPVDAEERLLEAPLAVRHSFRHFSDSAGPRLLDTLFRLGYHGGNSWDEKSGAARANLVAETDSGSVADSVAGIYEGIISLDFHHDEFSDVPGSISMRFVKERKSGRWILLTTDGLPEDPSDDRPIEELRKLPSDLHSAITFSFTDRADAFSYWKTQESSKAQGAVNVVH